MNIRLMDLQQSFSYREKFRHNAMVEIQKCLGGYLGEPATPEILNELSESISVILGRMTQSKDIKVKAEINEDGRLLLHPLTSDTQIVIDSIYQNTEFEETVNE